MTPFLCIVILVASNVSFEMMITKELHHWKGMKNKSLLDFATLCATEQLSKQVQEILVLATKKAVFFLNVESLTYKA